MRAEGGLLEKLVPRGLVLGQGSHAVCEEKSPGHRLDRAQAKDLTDKEDPGSQRDLVPNQNGDGHSPLELLNQQDRHLRFYF